MTDIKSLTRREVQILRCISNGDSNKEIALALNIEEQTVKNHISNLMRKLEAKNRTHAVVIYFSTLARILIINALDMKRGD